MFFRNYEETVIDTGLCFREYISGGIRRTPTSFHLLPIFNKDFRLEKRNFGWIRILCKSPISFIIDMVIR